MPENTEGEFHHYQYIQPDGTIPFSISILVRHNRSGVERTHTTENQGPVTGAELLAFHDGIRRFDGNFQKLIS